MGRLFHQVGRGPAGAGTLVCVALTAWCAAAPVEAHHSFAVHFVADRLVTVEGVVTEFRFSNPHGLLYLAVAQPDGTEEVWRIETNSPNALRRRGWSADSLSVGERISVEGFPARQEPNMMRVSKVVREDGSELIGQRPAAGLAPAPEDD